jgi:hypothetical protein
MHNCTGTRHDSLRSRRRILDLERLDLAPTPRGMLVATSFYALRPALGGGLVLGV